MYYSHANTKMHSKATGSLQQWFKVFLWFLTYLYSAGFCNVQKSQSQDIFSQVLLFFGTRLNCSCMWKHGPKSSVSDNVPHRVQTGCLNQTLLSSGFNSDQTICGSAIKELIFVDKMIQCDLLKKYWSGDQFYLQTADYKWQSVNITQSQSTVIRL